MGCMHRTSIPSTGSKGRMTLAQQEVESDGATTMFLNTSVNLYTIKPRSSIMALNSIRINISSSTTTQSTTTREHWHPFHFQCRRLHFPLLANCHPKTSTRLLQISANPLP